MNWPLEIEANQLILSLLARPKLISSRWKVMEAAAWPALIEFINGDTLARPLIDYWPGSIDQSHLFPGQLTMLALSHSTRVHLIGPRIGAGPDRTGPS